EGAVDKAPVWKGDADSPPVSARKAMELADRLRGRLVKDTDLKWIRGSVALEDAGRGQWFWVVSYTSFPGSGFTGFHPPLRLVVLMDGTVVQPEGEAEYKNGRWVRPAYNKPEKLKAPTLAPRK